jgi:hypothetical protein
MNEVEKRFDKEFVDKISGDMWQTTLREDIKSFIHSEIRRALESVVPEKCEVPSLPKTNKLGTLNNAQQTVLHIGRTNYNKAIEDINSNIKEYLGE